MSTARVFIGGLSRQIDGPELRRRFEEFGQVEEASVIVDKMSGYSRGFGFVTFTDFISVDKAIESLHGGEFGGRRISVRIANREDPAVLRRRDVGYHDRPQSNRAYDRGQEGHRDYREYRESSRASGPIRRSGFGYGYDRMREDRYGDRDLRDGPRDYREAREREFGREFGRDYPRDGSRDYRDRSREGSRELPRDGVKDLPRGRPRSLSRERPRDLSKDAMRNSARDGFGGPFGRETFRDGDPDFRRDRMMENSRFGNPYR